MARSKDDTVRDEILRESQNLFQNYGFKKTTMDDIATACGKAKSTLYHYFKNKDEVWHAVLCLELDQLRSEVTPLVDQEATVQDKIACYYIEFQKKSHIRTNLYRVMHSEKNYMQYLMNSRQHMINYESTYMLALLKQGIARKELTEMSPEDIGWLSELIIAGLFGVVFHIVDNKDAFDEKIMERYARRYIPRLFQ